MQQSSELFFVSSNSHKFTEAQRILSNLGLEVSLFKEILNSAHANVMEKSWKNFVSGYESSVGKKQCSKILELVAVIESRGRYATVV